MKKTFYSYLKMVSLPQDIYYCVDKWFVVRYKVLI